jgi:hypothetical protein
MNILHGYPVYRADAGAVSPDSSHPEIRWRCSRNINLGKFGLIAPTHFKLPPRFEGNSFNASGKTLQGQNLVAAERGLCHSNAMKCASSLLRDQHAVEAALTLPWSNGPVEGHVHRLKLIKRQMYGRASFDLLRLRVLHQA